jgi:uncharacterized protein YndB with AHSA1/START domain
MASIARSCRPSDWSTPRSSSHTPDGGLIVTSLFSEEKGKTRLTVTSLCESLEVRDMILKTGMEHGAALSYDRREDLVGELQRS